MKVQHVKVNHSGGIVFHDEEGYRFTCSARNQDGTREIRESNGDTYLGTLIGVVADKPFPGSKFFLKLVEGGFASYTESIKIGYTVAFVRKSDDCIIHSASPIAIIEQF